jgi:hypothetical protein
MFASDFLYDLLTVCPTDGASTTAVHYPESRSKSTDLARI